MPIPDFQSLMLPLLEHIADGNEYTIAGSRDILANQYSLTVARLDRWCPIVDGRGGMEDNSGAMFDWGWFE